MIKHRYDVYLNGGSDASLVLMRFPAMKSQFDNPADQIQLTIKPKSYQLRLEVARDPNGPNFCPDRAHGQNSNIYTSTKTNLEDSQLYVCKLFGGRLICHPISSLLTLRSDFSHFNIRDETTSEEIRPVSVRLAAPERQVLSSRVRETDQEDPLDEPKTLSYASLLSRDSSQQRMSLFRFCKPDPDAEPEDRKPFIIPPPAVGLEDRKPSIVPPLDTELEDRKPFVVSQPDVKVSKTIKQRVKDCLLKAKLISFEEARISTSDSNIASRDIVDALTEYAILVQGNWVVKSEILHGDSSVVDCTDVTGVSIRLFNAARDYLLWLFDQKRFVSRIEFINNVRIPDHDVLELFKELGTLNQETKLWEFKLPRDVKFLEDFAHVAQKQAALWKIRRANKLSIFK